MARTQAALQDETIDALVWRTTGGGSAAVDATLLLNRGLAALGPHLPEGTVVTLPDVAVTETPVDIVQLWD